MAMHLGHVLFFLPSTSAVHVPFRYVVPDSSSCSHQPVEQEALLFKAAFVVRAEFRQPYFIRRAAAAGWGQHASGDSHEQN